MKSYLMLKRNGTTLGYISNCRFTLYFLIHTPLLYHLIFYTLSLKVPTLEHIRESGKDSEECFRNVLKEVLEGKGRHPVTWSQLIDALKSKTVGFPLIAEEVRGKYSNTGDM